LRKGAPVLAKKGVQLCPQAAVVGKPERGEHFCSLHKQGQYSDGGSAVRLRLAAAEEDHSAPAAASIHYSIKKAATWIEESMWRLLEPALPVSMR
jgi:hypothetical protein